MQTPSVPPSTPTPEDGRRLARQRVRARRLLERLVLERLVLERFVGEPGHHEPVVTAATEAAAQFACFGSRCAALVIGDGPHATAEEAVAEAKVRLLAWHSRFSRFEPDSELSRLNRDPRAEVRVSQLMARMTDAAVTAASRTGGLVDATLVGEL